MLIHKNDTNVGAFTIPRLAAAGVKHLGETSPYAEFLLLMRMPKPVRAAHSNVRA